MKRLMLAGACALAVAVGAGPAQADFPYRPAGGSAGDYAAY
ncbi:MAG: hypothetical protein QOJ57_1833, partial [Thermoleophilaceae bacterium]|nr:hypothetical protein [Thermoleophilaceae bacterium]